MAFDKEEEKFLELTIFRAFQENYERVKDTCKERFDDRYVMKANSVKKNGNGDSEIRISLPKKVVKNPFTYIILLTVAIIFILLVNLLPTI